ncbi:lysozyme inhibitor LprI family protein [Oceanobacillus chungangensis]|uniref:Lysozyme inhibitor LprI-like N-terminal domain-containing protein n=1 Tax=Oceanobacillus chungangensis TaxID=1229152 RepID=A0A3D8PMG0_9BACI|nr:lysozyme inhibitor LprI family protein [Oceanobacillus chungangensis]RDW17316.1 hypothetical protein CWR45_13070 [Oceanobacillus chungangensis]
MGNNRKILLIMLTVVLAAILAACGNSSAKSNAKSDNESANNSSTQDANDDSLNKVITNEDKNITENASEGANHTELENQENPANHTVTNSNDEDDTADSTATNSNNEESSKSSNSDIEITESKKEAFQKKLNDTKMKADGMEATDTSTFALKKLENDRWDVWDDLLNEVYGVLENQLSAEDMDHLRDEQRNWIEYRDNSALEASLKYKGGTQEHLEYVSVLANLTEERCYELVEGYMK